MSLALALFAVASNPTALDTNSVSACSQQMGDSNHHTKSSGQAIRVGRSVICYDGAIEKGGETSFIALLNSIPIHETPIVVIKSQGGDVGAGLAMAEAILPRQATVIDYDYCLSSCANYVLASGKRRIVYKDAILGFHGGTESVSYSQILAAFKQTGAPNPSALARHAQVELRAASRRQSTFLKKAGISEGLFDWIKSFNNFADKKRHEICSDAAAYIVFSPTFLNSYGYHLSSYEGPTSPTTLRKALNRIGDSTSVACYVDQRHIILR